MEIETYRKLCKDENIIVTRHAAHRLLERKITVDDIKNVILTGEIIEEYPDDTPVESCLIFGQSSIGLTLHVVASADEFLHIITAYYPDPEKWKDDLKTRR